jgi:hypothetical protein
MALPAVVVPILLLRVVDPWEEEAIRAGNTAVRGEVLGSRRTGTHFGSTHIYRVIIRYHPPEAPEPLELPFLVAAPLEKGQAVSCAYLSEEPKRAALLGVETAGDVIAEVLLFLVIFMSVGPVVAWITAFVIWRRAAGRLAVLRDGDSTRGNVVRIKGSWQRVGRTYYQWVYYRYDHPTEGETESRYLLHPSHLEGVEEGSEIAVLYDTYRGRRCLPVLAAQLA